MSVCVAASQLIFIFSDSSIKFETLYEINKRKIQFFPETLTLSCVCVLRVQNKHSNNHLVICYSERPFWAFSVMRATEKNILCGVHNLCEMHFFFIRVISMLCFHCYACQSAYVWVMDYVLYYFCMFINKYS